MGKWIVAAALLGMPLASNAGKIVVEYTGSASSIDRVALAEAPPYSVDDPIMGTPIIATALAPAGSLASDSGGKQLRKAGDLVVERLPVKPGVCRP